MLVARMTAFLCLVFLTISLPDTISDTGSDTYRYDKDAAEIKYLKDTVQVIKQELNNERASRINMDREMTALTRRYREIILEHSYLKMEHDKFKKDLSINFFLTMESFESHALLNNKTLSSLFGKLADLENVASSLNHIKSASVVERPLMSKLLTEMETIRGLIEKSYIHCSTGEDIELIVQFINQTQTYIQNQENIRIQVENNVQSLQTDIHELNDRFANFSSVEASFRVEIHDTIMQLSEAIHNISVEDSVLLLGKDEDTVHVATNGWFL